MILNDTLSDAMSDLNPDVQYLAAREQYMAVQEEEDPVHSLPLGGLEFQPTR